MSVQPLAPLSSSILMSLICYYLPPKGTNADDKGEVENASNGSDSGEFEVCPCAWCWWFNVLQGDLNTSYTTTNRKMQCSRPGPCFDQLRYPSQSDWVPHEWPNIHRAVQFQCSDVSNLGIYDMSKGWNIGYATTNRPISPVQLSFPAYCLAYRWMDDKYARDYPIIHRDKALVDISKYEAWIIVSSPEPQPTAYTTTNRRLLSTNTSFPIERDTSGYIPSIQPMVQSIFVERSAVTCSACRKSPRFQDRDSVEYRLRNNQYTDSTRSTFHLYLPLTLLIDNQQVYPGLIHYSSRYGTSCYQQVWSSNTWWVHQIPSQGPTQQPTDSVCQLTQDYLLYQ